MNHDLQMSAPVTSVQLTRALDEILIYLYFGHWIYITHILEKL